jgi:hypothetical protein
VLALRAGVRFTLLCTCRPFHEGGEKVKTARSKKNWR